MYTVWYTRYGSLIVGKDGMYSAPSCSYNLKNWIIIDCQPTLIFYKHTYSVTAHHCPSQSSSLLEGWLTPTVRTYVHIKQQNAFTCKYYHNNTSLNMSIQIHKYVYIEDPIDLNSSSYSVNIQKSIQISDTLNFKYILIQQSIFYQVIYTTVLIFCG